MGVRCHIKRSNSCTVACFFSTLPSQQAEAELQAAHPPPLLVLGVCLVGHAAPAADAAGAVAVQHCHPVDARRGHRHVSDVARGRAGL